MSTPGNGAPPQRDPWLQFALDLSELLDPFMSRSPARAVLQGRIVDAAMDAAHHALLQKVVGAALAAVEDHEPR